MENLYQRLRTIDSNNRNIVCTVVDGKHFGEKALFSNEHLIWETSADGFFSHSDFGTNEIKKSGCYTVGSESAFCEIVGNEKKIIVCGAGHVSIPVVQLGRMMGFKVTVLEDRPKFADDARRAGAHKVICDAFSHGLENVSGDKDTYFVIVTRGHRYDMECLEKISRKEHAYIGMIGSRMRVKKVIDTLIEKGCNENVLKNVYTPIGLDIGAETPEEIAIAIMAQIIEVKNKINRSGGYSKKMLRSIMELEVDNRKKILATIVSRKGSAPRAVGTKMLILPDGNCIDTIGGGCVESEVVRKGIHMLRTGKVEPQIYHVDMTGQNAEEDGMVCGGEVDIMFEVVP